MQSELASVTVSANHNYTQHKSQRVQRGSLCRPHRPVGLSVGPALTVLTNVGRKTQPTLGSSIPWVWVLGLQGGWWAESICASFLSTPECGCDDVTSYLSFLSTPECECDITSYFKFLLPWLLCYNELWHKSPSNLLFKKSGYFMATEIKLSQ